MIIKQTKIKCLHCNHEWFPRKLDVRRCPKCQTAHFDKPKVESGLSLNNTKLNTTPKQQTYDNTNR